MSTIHEGDFEFSEVSAAVSNLGQIEVSTSATAPAAPVSGGLLFALANAGLVELSTIDSQGVQTPLGADWGGSQQSLWTPGAVATQITAIGQALTVTGTISQPATAISEYALSQIRTQLATAATINAVAEARDAAASYWGGNAAGRGGYRHYFGFGAGTGTPDLNAQISVGLSSNVAAIAGDATALPNWVGCCKIAGNANWQFAIRQSTDPATVVDLGLAVGPNQYLEMMLVAPPGAGTVYAKVCSVSYSGLTVLLDTSYSGPQIPTPSAFLGRRVGVRTQSAVAHAATLYRVHSRGPLA